MTTETTFDFEMAQLKDASGEMAEHILPDPTDLCDAIEAAVSEYQTRAEKAAAEVWRSGVQEALRTIRVRPLVDQPGVVEITSVPDDLTVLKQSFDLFADDIIEEAESDEEVEAFVQKVADRARSFFAVKGSAKWKRLRSEGYL